MTKIAFAALALTTIALAGCSEQASQPYQACVLEVAQICTASAETQIAAALRVADVTSPREAEVVPYVVPLVRPDGTLAAEVDCYANTDFRTFSIVHTAVAIPPKSRDAVDFLRDRHLCTGDETESLARR